MKMITTAATVARINKEALEFGRRGRVPKHNAG